MDSSNRNTNTITSSQRCCLLTSRTALTTAQQGGRNRRWNVRNILVGSLFLSLFIALICPNQQQQQLAEGAKLKKEGKKQLKSLVKGFVVSKLTTRKNFMPLPVPIPGKWQQILTAAFDSGLLLASKSSSNSNQQQKFNPGSSKKYGTPSSIGSDSMSVSKFLASKLIEAATGGAGSASSSIGASFSSSDNKDKNNNDSKIGGKSFNLKRVEKQVRVTAAKYAGKIIAQQLPNKNSMLNGGVSSSAASSEKLNFGKKLLHGFHLTDRKSDASSSSSSGQHNSAGTAIQQNDLLVTAHNLLKFIQQFRELDRTKLLDLNKMSLANLVSASASSNNNKVPPIIAMNINNKKTLMNKLNYIHKLSTLNNHRHDHLLDLAVVASRR